MISDFKKSYLEHLSLFETAFQDSDLIEKIEECSLLINSCLDSGSKVVIFGNGGSAADSMHISAEFVGSFKKPKKALNVICLNSNLASVTSIANDFSFENIFSKQIEAYVGESDLVIGLTTSGKSRNVIKAFEKAKELGARSIALCGENTKQINADKVISIPSSDTPRIQEAHMFIGHFWAESTDKHFRNGESD